MIGWNENDWTATDPQMVVHVRHAGARGVATGGAALFSVHAVLRARAARGHHVGLHQLAPLLGRTPDAPETPHGRTPGSIYSWKYIILTAGRYVHFQPGGYSTFNCQTDRPGHMNIPDTWVGMSLTRKYSFKLKWLYVVYFIIMCLG